MRHVKWIFVVLLASSLTSFVDKGKSTGGLNVGDVAPDIDIEPTSNKANNADFSLSDVKGKYVLLSFWASYDAQSRMQNIKMSNVLKSTDLSIEMVSISFDEFSSIYKETLRIDNINTSNCYLVPDGNKSTIYKTYKLDRGFKNYLLDEDGVIIAKDITAAELPTLLRMASSYYTDARALKREGYNLRVKI
ncbi:alkyl hydroperoxide reductase/ Thiol specific antioxidant/ Mal allergen [Bacteroides coprosuis DSM 18011]|uniref:Alkyl hydroperoxide reductase/ Thiol specific antioxidant/ Mal allergen n=2 Tax=Bacteroides TaxID=816 RepID=F3ZTK2_9BACE|nr:thioredoxin-like domain-containing protein [Bacteroides coprosuis]EGJ71233.1 alkyl hydroperoxide reductase/ Thiol specific antioxidant/ Mal allergen [Bacteroides coprosuis DSM 18011]